jgi:hypothetical protein
MWWSELAVVIVSWPEMCWGDSGMLTSGTWLCFHVFITFKRRVSDGDSGACEPRQSCTLQRQQQQHSSGSGTAAVCNLRAHRCDRPVARLLLTVRTAENISAMFCYWACLPLVCVICIYCSIFIVCLEEIFWPTLFPISFSKPESWKQKVR